MQAIASYLAFTLPSGFDRELWFLRSFFRVFRYGRGALDTPKREIQRRRIVARDLVARHEPLSFMATKLQMRASDAEILFDYPLQRTLGRWHQGTEEDAYENALKDEEDRFHPPNEPDFETEDEDPGPSMIDEIMTQIPTPPKEPPDED